MYTYIVLQYYLVGKSRTRSPRISVPGDGVQGQPMALTQEWH